MLWLLMFPFLWILEWMCNVFLKIVEVGSYMIKAWFWMCTVMLWDIVALGFHIVACIVCLIFKWKIPQLKAGKWFILYSKLW